MQPGFARRPSAACTGMCRNISWNDRFGSEADSLAPLSEFPLIAKSRPLAMPDGKAL